MVTRQIVDVNKIFLVTGISNLISGFLVTLPGYPWVMNMLFGYRNKHVSRLYGWMFSLFFFILFFISINPMEYQPKFMLSGILVYIGYSFFIENVMYPRKTMPFIEWLQLVIGSLLIFYFGFNILLIYSFF